MGTWRPTIPGEGLLWRGTVLASSRPGHPRTNVRLERFHRSGEEEFWNRKPGWYINHYNERRCTCYWLGPA